MAQKNQTVPKPEGKNGHKPTPPLTAPMPNKMPHPVASDMNQVNGLPPHLTAQTMRQTALLQMQKQQGNGVANAVAKRSLASLQQQVIQREGGGGGSITDEAVNKVKAQQARAQKILKDAFGNIKTIVASKVEVLDDAALKGKYDEMKIRKKHNNPKTGQPWQTNDASKVFSKLEGFADTEAQVIYVLDDNDATEAGRVALMVHETLHMNAAGGFASAVGPDIDEGTTEYLTIKACKAAKITPPTAYARQVGLVEKLAAIVGEASLEKAYFGGVATLKSTYDTIRGEGTFEKLHKILTESKDMEKALKSLSAPRSPDWVKEKIKMIEAHLDSWWVSDEDMAQIKTLLGTLTPQELAKARETLAPKAINLSDHGQRATFRLALGVGKS